MIYKKEAFHTNVKTEGRRRTRKGLGKIKSISNRVKDITLELLLPLHPTVYTQI